MDYIYSTFLRVFRFIYPAAILTKINVKQFLFKTKNFRIFDHSLIRFNQYKALGDKKIYNFIDRYSFFPDIYINSDSLVVDIGANIGEFGVGSNYYGCKDYIAIEPTSLAFKCLKKNILKKKNNFNSIKLFNKLLLDKKKLVNFYTNDSWSRDNSIYKNNLLPDLLFKIKKYKTVTLDILIFNKIRNHKNIFVKMDAEVAEDLILIGAKKTLRIIKNISIDCGREKKGRGNYGKCLKILKKYKFKILKKQGKYSHMLYGIH